MSNRRTRGIDDLVATLVKQHGMETSISAARNQLQTVKGQERIDIWWCTLNRLKSLRDANLFAKATP